MNSDICKVGLYIRISREDDIKFDESQSIINQRKLLEEYVRDKRFDLIDTYVDDGYSGTNFDRPAFNKMIKDIESKKINTVITKDLSRLGRDFIEVGQYVEKYFPLNKIRYIAINDNYDSDNSNGNDMNAFKFILNDYYAKDISNKVKSTINSKKRNGEFLGATPPYGYKFKSKDNRKELIIDDETSNVVKRMFNLYASGKSLFYIAQLFTNENIPIPSVQKNLNRGLKSTAFGTWQTRTIDEILKNPTYIGNLTQGRRKKVSYKVKKIVRVPKEDWIICENTHEAIIDKDTFSKVQNIYEANKGRKQSKHDTLLKGFIICKECGHTIGINHAHGKYYCTCNYYRKYSKLNVCSPHSIPYDVLENLILTEIRKECKKSVKGLGFNDKLKNNDKLLIARKKVKTLIDNKQNEININKSASSDLYIEKLKKVIDEETYKNVYNKLNVEYRNLVKELEELKNEYSNLENDNLKPINYNSLSKDFLSMKKPTRELLANIIDKIEIDENKNIDIYYKIKKSY